MVGLGEIVMVPINPNAFLWCLPQNHCGRQEKKQRTQEIEDKEKDVFIG
jgi:hypothetical protein